MAEEADGIVWWVTLAGTGHHHHNHLLLILVALVQSIKAQLVERCDLHGT